MNALTKEVKMFTIEQAKKIVDSIETLMTMCVKEDNWSDNYDQEKRDLIKLLTEEEDHA
jgi:hypothetical protein